MSKEKTMVSAAKVPQVRYSAAYPTGRERFEDFSPNLFWDADPADLDFSKHMKYVVQRVLDRCRRYADARLDTLQQIIGVQLFDRALQLADILL